MDIVALELIKNLQVIDHKNEYFIFVKEDEDTSVLNETENFKIISLPGSHYPYWEQVLLPKAVKKYGCEILHCTSNTAPLNCDVPLVTTLHDIIYMESGYSKILNSSASTYQKFGNVYRKLLVPQVVKKSDKVITVSNYEKNRIAEFFDMTGDSKLAAVYNGVSEHFKTPIGKQELIRVKEKYQLPDQFFFFLGNTDPKKNTKGTLKAFSDFLKKNRSGYKLVMLDYDLAELKKLLHAIGDPQLLDHIVLTGYIVNSDLPALYAQSSIFLYPSLRESFGIPILEAMACGVPVITSNTSSMPEISGEAAHIVDPYNSEEITAAMLQLVTDEAYRNSLVEKGELQSTHFSWKIMAQRVLVIYNEVINNLKIAS